MTPLLQISGLKTWFFTSEGIVRAIDGIDLQIDAGKTLALVGESGCGKSMTALSILRLVPQPGRIVEGEVRFDGEDLLKLPTGEMQRIRGNRISMIFQEPMTSLNPVLTVGDQIAEGLRLHQGLENNAIEPEAIRLLQQVGISDPKKRLRDFPHQLSGGMRQRVMIAMALACDPQLLIADEPTTALDVTIQAQIMDLLSELKQERQMATLLITHDLGIVAGSADEVAVMYAGYMVERAPVHQLFEQPAHPYTRALLQCIPRFGQKERLTTLPGQVPSAGACRTHCPFRDRCPEAYAPCEGPMPELKEIRPGHWARCYKAFES